VSHLAYTSIAFIPLGLQLVVGVLGLIFSIRGRARGVSGLMVGAFAVMLVTVAASIVWQFVTSDLASWTASSHLSASDINLIFTAVNLPLGAAAVLSWLLVAIAVAKGSRLPVRFGGAPGSYPMAQPGFAPPQPGYPQPGYSQPGYPQTGPGGPAGPTQQPPG
jgi:hypothetical protein